MGQSDRPGGFDGVLQHKVRPPGGRDGDVTRRALLDRMAASDVRLVVLQAPAGYGKTTLARQWAEVDGRAASWVSLDAGDDDPVALLRHVVHSLDVAHPAPSLVAAVRVPEGGATPVLAALEASWADGPPRLVVLDDVHLVTSPGSGELFGRMADLVPAGSTLVLSGRTPPPVHGARRELGGTALVLRREDLAFDDGESRGALARWALLGEPGLADDLVGRAEGWPAGLHLLALSVADAAPEAATATLAGWDPSDRRCDEYVSHEVLSGIDPEDRDVLVRSSVLEAMTGDLCDEVLGTTGSAERLDRLASSANLFVVRLDGGTWYRFHHLFRDVLLARLRSAAPGDEPGLRASAARWLDRFGHPAEAVRQAVASGDEALAASMVLRHLLPAIEAGRGATVAGWLAGFAPDELRRRPELALASAWCALLGGRPDEVRRWLDLLAASPEADLPAGSRPQDAPPFVLALDALVMVTNHGGTKAALDAAGRVREAGEDSSPWWPTAGLVGAVSAHLLGLDPDPRERLDEAEFGARGRPTTHAVIVAQQSLACFAAGDVAVGVELADRALDELTSSGVDGSPLTAPVLGAAALAAARRRSPRWRDLVARGRDQLDLVAGLALRTQIQVRLAFAEAAAADGDVDLAAELLAETAPLLAEEPDVVTLHERHDALVELVAGQRAATRRPGVDLTAAERRVLGELATHRSLEEIGRRLYVSRNTVKSHANAIYRKLGVSGRSAAVEAAGRSGLLDG